MAFKNPLYTITNQSTQRIHLAVNAIRPDQAATGSMVPPNVASIITIEASKTLKIEQIRVDDAQILSLRRKLPIKVFTSVNTPFVSPFDMEFLFVSDDYPEPYFTDSADGKILAANLL